MNRMDIIASRVAVKFDTKKELETYRREHKPKPSTKLELRNEQERQERYKDRTRHGSDASTEYRSWMATVRQDLRLLDKQLTKHELRQKQSPNDYGYVGDISHVESGLQEMVRFLGV